MSQSTTRRSWKRWFLNRKLMIMSEIDQRCKKIRRYFWIRLLMCFRRSSYVLLLEEIVLGRNILWWRLIKLLELDPSKPTILILSTFITSLEDFKMDFGGKESSLNILNSFHAHRNNGFLLKENIQQLSNNF